MRAFLIILGFCGSLAQAAQGVVATDFWMRAMPPGQHNSAAYITLVNHSTEPRFLISASSEAARSVEIHSSRQSDGMWRMQSLEKLALPVGEKVLLSPGGVHLMVFGLLQAPQAGDKIPFELLLDNGDIVNTTAEVLSVGAASRNH